MVVAAWYAGSHLCCSLPGSHAHPFRRCMSCQSSSLPWMVGGPYSPPTRRPPAQLVAMTEPSRLFALVSAMSDSARHDLRHFGDEAFPRGTSRSLAADRSCPIHQRTRHLDSGWGANLRLSRLSKLCRRPRSRGVRHPNPGHVPDESRRRCHRSWKTPERRTWPGCMDIAVPASRTTRYALTETEVHDLDINDGLHRLGK